MFLTMRKSPHSRSKPLSPKGFILGRASFARISAVEGIALTPEMQSTLERFDREGLSADERRHRIMASFRSATH